MTAGMAAPSAGTSSPSHRDSPDAAVLEKMPDDSDSTARTAALKALDAIGAGSRISGERLAQLLADPDAGVRSGALRLPGQRGPEASWKSP